MKSTRLTVSALLATAGLLLGSAAFANTHTNGGTPSLSKQPAQPEQITLHKLPASQQKPLTPKDIVLQTLHQEMQGVRILAIEPAPLPGVFEILTRNGVIYFYPGSDFKHHPESSRIFFGTLFTRNGKNLTQDAIYRMTLRIMKHLPMSAAIDLHNPSAQKGAPEIYEFINPACDNCQKYESWMTNDYERRGKHFNRKLIVRLTKKPSKEELARAFHLICSKDKYLALQQIYGLKPHKGPWAICPEAKSVLKEQTKIADKLAIAGTPTLLIDGRTVNGFSPLRISHEIEAEENRLAFERAIPKKVSKPVHSAQLTKTKVIHLKETK